MTDAVRVSVAMATRNGAAFIDAQIASIVAQSRPVDEVVVSDDDSSDDTVEQARDALAAAGIPVRVLRNPEPLGVVRNFEAAISAADGDVIVLSDQDDVWSPDRVARSLAALADPRVLLAHGNARRVGGDGSPLAGDLFWALRVTRRERGRLRRGEALDVYLRRNLVTGATAAFRRELAAVALPVPDGWFHDEWLGIVAAALGRVVVVEEPLIDYRQHAANEIGAADPTIARRMERLAESRDVRNLRLLRRAEGLVAFAQGPRVGHLPDAVAELAAGKLRHEQARSALPASRLRRIGPVLRELATGRYSRFGRARFDVVRDLVQPVDRAEGTR